MFFDSHFLRGRHHTSTISFLLGQRTYVWVKDQPVRVASMLILLPLHNEQTRMQNILAVTEEVRIASVFGMLLVRIESLTESCMLAETVRASPKGHNHACSIPGIRVGTMDQVEIISIVRSESVTEPKNRFVG